MYVANPMPMNPIEISDLIFDVGAHKGEDSDFYLKLGYRVVAVEGNPALAEQLRKRFDREISDGRYNVIDKVIADSMGSSKFYLNKVNSLWGTADPIWARRNKLLGADSYEIEVECISFSELVKTYGCPYYMKIDIEGADMLCINALRDMDCRPKYLSLESTKTSWLGLLDEINTLEALGYSRFKVVNQRKHNRNMFRDVNGKDIAYRFEYGASGPFGENLGGTWLTKEEAIRRYMCIYILYKTVGDNTFLERLLKMVPIVRQIFALMPWYDTHAMR
jgi:FkbM family methyltransferase